MKESNKTWCDRCRPELPMDDMVRCEFHGKKTLSGKIDRCIHCHNGLSSNDVKVALQEFVEKIIKEDFINVKSMAKEVFGEGLLK